MTTYRGGEKWLDPSFLTLVLTRLSSSLDETNKEKTVGDTCFESADIKILVRINHNL